jgi:hypothetical protein
MSGRRTIDAEIAAETAADLDAIESNSDAKKWSDGLALAHVGNTYFFRRLPDGYWIPFNELPKQSSDLLCNVMESLDDGSLLGGAPPPAQPWRRT